MPNIKYDGRYLKPSDSRRSMHQWFAGHGGFSQKYKTNHALIYNSGRHLYCSTWLIPGSFISAPDDILFLLRFKVARMGYELEKGLKVTHHGHVEPLCPSDARLSMENGRGSLVVTIPPLHMVYFMRSLTTHRLEFLCVRLPVPLSVLSHLGYEVVCG